MVYESGKTQIYFDNKPFLLCKGALISLDINDSTPNSFDTIDELIEHLERENKVEILETRKEGDQNSEFRITSQEEFFVHCSNLQAWFELNYDTAILDHRLAFPLLRELAWNGDKNAQKVYKEEIAKRFKTQQLTVALYLIVEGFLDILNPDEYSLLSLQNNHQLRKALKTALKAMDNDPQFNVAIEILEYLSFSKGDKQALRILKFFLTHLMFSQPKKVRNFLDYNYPKGFCLSEYYYYFIKHSPTFLELLIMDSNIIEQFHLLLNKLNNNNLKNMLDQILYLVNCDEPKDDLHKHLTECLEEHSVIARTHCSKQLK